MTAFSAARALTRAEFADLADEAVRLAREVGYWDATHGALGQRRVAARDETDAHAALMAAYDALTARAEAAESAIAADSARLDWLGALVDHSWPYWAASLAGEVRRGEPSGMTLREAIDNARAVIARQRAEAVIGTAGLWPEARLPDDAMRAGDGA